MNFCVFDINNESNIIVITHEEMLKCDLKNKNILFLLGINKDNIKLVTSLIEHKIIDFENFKEGSLTTQSYNKWLKSWRQRYINNKFTWRIMCEFASSNDVKNYILSNSNIISCSYDPELETCKQRVDRFIDTNKRLKAGT